MSGWDQKYDLEESGQQVSTSATRTLERWWAYALVLSLVIIGVIWLVT